MIGKPLHLPAQDCAEYSPCVDQHTAVDGRFTGRRVQPQLRDRLPRGPHHTAAARRVLRDPVRAVHAVMGGIELEHARKSFPQIAVVKLLFPVGGLVLHQLLHEPEQHRRLALVRTERVALFLRTRKEPPHSLGGCFLRMREKRFLFRVAARLQIRLQERADIRLRLRFLFALRLLRNGGLVRLGSRRLLIGLRRDQRRGWANLFFRAARKQRGQRH